MKIIPALALSALLTTTCSFAQTSPIHPGDSTAQYLGELHVSVTIEPSEPGPTLDSNNQANSTAHDIEETFFVWAVGPNIDYVGDAASLSVQGSGNWIDSVSTASLLALLSEQAPLSGKTEGYATCYSITTPGTSHVFQSQCVNRGGSGSSTYLTVCAQSGYTNRTFELYCTSTGDPVATCVAGCSP